MPVIQSESIAHLPRPVQRSLRRSGVIGRDMPSAVTVSQEGRIRRSPHGRWLRFAAEETYTIDPPGFVWNAAIKLGGVTVGRACDSLEDGRGRLHVRLLGMITVAEATGPEVDQGSLLRWLNETMWFPAVWASSIISWEPMDDTAAIGVVSVGDVSVRGEFQFDVEGRLVDFRADRYREVGTGFEMTPWSTPLYRHSRLNGLELPSHGRGVWALDEGEFEYIQIRANNVRYSG